MTTTHTATPDTLAAVLKAAAAGDVVELAPGEYGELVPTRALAIHGPPEAVVESVTIRASGAGATLKGFTVRRPPNAKFGSGVRLYKTSDIILTGLTVRTSPAPDTGKLNQRGVSIEDCDRVRVEACDVSECNDGVVPLFGSEIAIVGNRIHNTRGSPISGAATMGLTIDDNDLGPAFPLGWGDTANDGDHADMIHLWTRGATADMGPVRIRGNRLRQGDGVAILGIFLQDNNAEHDFADVEIARNIIHLGNRQGIAVGGLQPTDRITDNVLLPTPGTVQGKGPTIILRGCSPVVTGNVTADCPDLELHRQNTFLADDAPEAEIASRLAAAIGDAPAQTPDARDSRIAELEALIATIRQIAIESRTSRTVGPWDRVRALTEGALNI